MVGRSVRFRDGSAARERLLRLGSTSPFDRANDHPTSVLAHSRPSSDVSFMLWSILGLDQIRRESQTRRAINPFLVSNPERRDSLR